MSSTLKPFIFFLILLGITTYGSLSTGETTEKFMFFKFENSDKLMHAIMYFLLTLSLVYGMVKITGLFNHWKVYLVVIAAPAGYGLFMEVLQYLVTSNRQAETADFLANMGGIGLAFMCSFFYYSLKKHV